MNKLLLTALVATMWMVNASTAQAQTSYETALDQFSFPVETCGDPRFMTSDMSNDDIEQLNLHNEDWRACQALLQDGDTRALRRFITGPLGGQWEPRGNNFAWSTAPDCYCKQAVRALWALRDQRSMARQMANERLLADIAAAQMQIEMSE